MSIIKRGIKDQRIENREYGIRQAKQEFEKALEETEDGRAKAEQKAAGLKRVNKLMVRM